MSTATQDPLYRVSFPRMVWELLTARGNVYRFALRLREKFGKNVFLPFALPAYILSDPRDLRHVLVTNSDSYQKLGALVIAKKFLGDGLVTSEGEFHHRNRRAMQPMFHRQKIENFARIMVDRTEKRVAEWKDGDTLDMLTEMTHITLSIISETLFSVDLDKQSTALSSAVIEAQRFIVNEVRLPIPIPFLQAEFDRRCKKAVAELDVALAEVVHPRTLPGAEPKDDMLQMLLDIRFEDGGKMSEKELRDEIITLFVAGHETTSASIAWAFYLLSQNPEVEAKLCEEIDRVLQGRTPRLEDLPQLRYTEMVMWESMRIYPVVWVLGRLNMQEDPLPSGTTVAKGSQVLMVNYAAHRDPVFFPEPEKFKPERFEEKIGIQQGFLPFGAGMRSCIGEPFAKMEFVFILALIYQKYRFALVNPEKVKPDTLIIYRPKHGLSLRAIRR